MYTKYIHKSQHTFNLTVRESYLNLSFLSAIPISGAAAQPGAERGPAALPARAPAPLRAAARGRPAPALAPPRARPAAPAARPAPRRPAPLAPASAPAAVAQTTGASPTSVATDPADRSPAGAPPAGALAPRDLDATDRTADASASDAVEIAAALPGTPPTAVTHASPEPPVAPAVRPTVADAAGAVGSVTVDPPACASAISLSAQRSRDVAAAARFSSHPTPSSGANSPYLGASLATSA